MNSKPLSLEEQLERSLAAIDGGARFVSQIELPTDSELHAVHAQLARACRIANGEEPGPCPF